MRKGAILALTAAVVAGGFSWATTATLAAAAPARKAGFASTVKQWQETRVPALRLGCNEDGLCFGPPVHNVTNGSTRQFSALTATKGVVDDYLQNFPAGTTIVEAKKQIMAAMPADAKVTSFVVDTHGRSCGLMTIKSATAAKALTAVGINDPKGLVGVELSYINADLDYIYDPANIQLARVGATTKAPTEDCG
jgi:hypothetical protein